MKSTVCQRVKPLLQKTVRTQNKDYPNGKMMVTLDTIEVEPSILIWDEWLSSPTPNSGLDTYF